MIKKIPLSVLMPVKNEGHQISRALASVQWASEIIIVDSQSTDNTLEIAKQYKAKIVQFYFNGTWPKKRNWALETLAFENEWVLILDADEVMPESAREEIEAIVTCPTPPHNGYWINRRFFFIGEWLRHAYFPNWIIRLVRHPYARYQRITDNATASGDNEVHEPFVVQGSTGHLNSMMDHYAFPTIDSFVERHNRYSNWEAHVAFDKKSAPSNNIQDQKTRIKWWLKHIFLKLPFRPTLRFLYVYIFQKGFLDGKRGYYFAKLHGFYEFLNVAKTFELKIQKNKCP
jgi:glycosyltransferase involved in cell wall biosynthesis